MIRTPHNEYVRVKLPDLERDAAEIGRLLAEAFGRGEHLRREKARMLDEFRREEEALGAEIAGLIREQRGDPVKRHEDIACEVWYDLTAGERILIRPARPPHERTQEEFESDIVSRRPLTPQERAEAERLAKEQEAS